MMQIKFTFKSLYILLIIVGLLLPMIDAIAIPLGPTPSLTFPPANTPPPQTDLGTPPRDPAEINPSNFLRPPLPPSGVVSRDTLSKWREEDRKQCEVEATGKKNPTIGQAIAGAITKPLKDGINEQLGLRAIPDSVNQTISTTASKAIEEELQTEIQDGLREGLKEELPKTLAEKLEAARATGLTDADIQANRGLFTGLVRDSIRESLPRVLNEDFVGNRVSNAIDKGLRRSLQESLRLNFGQVAKPTIETYYRAQIETVLAQIPSMVKEQVENIQATIQGTQAGFQAVIQNVKSCGLDPLCVATRVAIVALTKDVTQLLPEIDQIVALIENLILQIKGAEEFLVWLGEFTKQENQDRFVEDMINGFALQLEQSLTAPKNIEKLADAITGAISGPINNSIKNSINQVLDSAVKPIRALEDAIDSIDERIINQAADAIDLQLSMTIAQLTNPAVIIIDHIGDSLSSAIDQTIGATLYPLAQDIVTQSNAAGSAVAQGINNVGYGIQDLLFPRPQIDILPDDFNGPLGPGQIYQSEQDLLQSEGIKIVPDSIATLRPGEIHYSDYQALLPESAPLTGAINDVSNTAAEATQNSAGQVTTEALNNQVGTGEITSNIAQGFKAGMGQAFAAGVGSVFEGVPYVGPILAQVVEQIIATALAAVGMAPVAGGFPVMDVGVIWSTKGILAVNQGVSKTSGKILSTEKQTAELTEKILNLQIQSCTNLKIMRRTQLLAEEEMFVWSPNARKANAQALYLAQVNFINNLVNQGRELSDGITNIATVDAENNRGPLIIRNLPDHINEAGQEANMAFQDDLKKLEADEENHPNAKIIRRSLEAQDNQDLAAAIGGTLTKTEITKFRETPETLTNDEFWNTFQALGQPENNIYGQKLIAQDLRNQRVATAENAARDEYLAGAGYAGTRECPPEFQTQDPNTGLPICAKWQTLTPGSTIGAYTEEVFASPLRQAENFDEDFIKGEVALSASRLGNLSNLSANVPPYSETAEKSIFKGPDPCPGPGPCPSTGWSKNTSQSTSVKSTKVPSSLSGVTANNNIIIKPPDFILSVKKVTIAEVIAGTKENKTIIEWKPINPANVTTCEATNDWVSGRVGNNLKTAGDDLSVSGSATIVHPVNFRTVPPKFTQQLATTGVTLPIGSLITKTKNQLKSLLTFNPENGSGINSGDTYQLTFMVNGSPFTLTVGGPGTNALPTAAEVINLFKKQIELEKESPTALGRELDRYTFAYFPDEASNKGFLTMSPKLTYELTCTKGDQTANKELTLTRQ